MRLKHANCGAMRKPIAKKRDRTRYNGDYVIPLTDSPRLEKICAILRKIAQKVQFCLQIKITARPSTNHASTYNLYLDNN